MPKGERMREQPESGCDADANPFRRLPVFRKFRETPQIISHRRFRFNEPLRRRPLQASRRHEGDTHGGGGNYTPSQKKSIPAQAYIGAAE